MLSHHADRGLVSWPTGASQTVRRALTVSRRSPDDQEQVVIAAAAKIAALVREALNGPRSCVWKQVCKSAEISAFRLG